MLPAACELGNGLVLEPNKIVRRTSRSELASGRTRITREGQALCFFAGANSIFYGDKLLTADNPAADSDVALLRELGLHIDGASREPTVAAPVSAAAPRASGDTPATTAGAAKAAAVPLSR